MKINLDLKDGVQMFTTAAPSQPSSVPTGDEKNTLSRRLVAMLGWRWIFARRMYRRAQTVLDMTAADAPERHGAEWLEMDTHAHEAEAWNAFQSAMEMYYKETYV